ncbi:MAG: hypothetical protein HYT15_03235 [Candidatus Magasanikbacteria bacterium]|nr:hypothetical protein [Candidatus Magasanikbacteria bacterium]
MERPKEGKFSRKEILQDYKNEFSWLYSYVGLAVDDPFFKEQLISICRSEFEKNQGGVLRSLKSMANAKYGMDFSPEEYEKEVEQLDKWVEEINRAFVNLFRKETIEPQDEDSFISTINPLVKNSIELINSTINQ